MFSKMFKENIDDVSLKNLTSYTESGILFLQIMKLLNGVRILIFLRLS